MASRTAIRIGLFALGAILTSSSWAQHINAKDAPCRKAPDAAQCFLAAAQDANSSMNDRYNRIWKSLASRPKQQAQIKTAQDLWLQTRSADCAAERDLHPGGDATAIYYACVEAVTRRRAADLPLLFGR